jgi:hypothetical protein
LNLNEKYNKTILSPLSSLLSEFPHRDTIQVTKEKIRWTAKELDVT